MRILPNRFLWILLTFIAGCGAAKNGVHSAKVNIPAETANVPAETEETQKEASIFGVWQMPSRITTYNSKEIRISTTLQIGPDVLTKTEKCQTAEKWEIRSTTARIKWDEAHSFEVEEAISWSLVRTGEEDDGCDPTISEGKYQVSLENQSLILTRAKDVSLLTQWQPLPYSYSDKPSSIFGEWVIYDTAESHGHGEKTTIQTHLYFTIRPSETTLTNHCILAGEPVQPTVTIPSMVQFRKQDRGVMTLLQSNSRKAERETEKDYVFCNAGLHQGDAQFTLFGNSLNLNVNGKNLFLRPVLNALSKEPPELKYSDSPNSILGKWSIFTDRKTFSGTESLEAEFQKDFLILSKECRTEKGTVSGSIKLPIVYNPKYNYAENFQELQALEILNEKGVWFSKHNFRLQVDRKASLTAYEQNRSSCTVNLEELLGFYNYDAMYAVANNLLFIRQLSDHTPKGRVMTRVP